MSALSAEDWGLSHSDAWHPESRENCEHCQEMIRIHGEMPSIEEIYEYERRLSKKEKRKKPIPAKLRWEIFERDNFTCKHCGKRTDLSIDHIKPESKGGTLDKENLQTLCRSCNSSKKDREVIK